MIHLNEILYYLEESYLEIQSNRLDVCLQILKQIDTPKLY